MGAPDIGGALDQIGARRPRQRARTESGAQRRMKARAWRIAARRERAARRQMGAARHHLAAAARRALGIARRKWRRQDAAAQTLERRRLADAHSVATARTVRTFGAGRQRDRSARRQGAHRLHRRRAAGQVCPLWLESARAGSDCDRTASHRSAALAASRALQARRVAATLRACGIERSRRGNSCPCPTERSAWCCWRAHWCSDPDWLLLDELYNGLDRPVPAAHRCGARKRARAAVSRGSRPRIARWTCRRYGLADRTVRRPNTADQAAAGTDLARLRTRADEAAPRASRRRRGRRSRRPRGPVLLQLTMSICMSSTGRCCARSNWQLRRGEHWSVFGANGAGKSSFLKLLYGDLSPALGGRIERAGSPAARPSPNGSGTWAMSRRNCKAQYAVDVSMCWNWWRAAAIRASVCRRRSAQRSEEWRRVARVFQIAAVLAAPAARTVLRATAPRAHRARHGGGSRAFCLLDEPFTGLDPQAARRHEALARASDAAPADAGYRRAPCGGPAARHDAWVAFT